MTKDYITITCCRCGEVGENSYSEPYASQMVERQMCFTCSHWTDYDIDLTKGKHSRETIIDGSVYGPGNRTSGSFRGMAGRRFDIEYIGTSAWAGKRITTFDLWSSGQMPDWLRAKWPDTARFLNGAERAEFPPGGLYEAAWNSSNTRNEPYPLPREICV